MWGSMGQVVRHRPPRSASGVAAVAVRQQAWQITTGEVCVGNTLPSFTEHALLDLLRLIAHESHQVGHLSNCIMLFVYERQSEHSGSLEDHCAE